MARFYENDRNTPPPRPPRPMPPGDVARRPQPQRPMSPPMPSGPRGGGVSPRPMTPPRPRNRDDVPERIPLPGRRGDMPERRNLPYFPGRDDGQIMPMPQRPMSPPMPPGMPPGLEGRDRLMPPAGSFDRRAGQGLREALGALVSFLNTPGRVVRGAVEGGAQAINPDFEMPDYSNAQIPGVDFMNFITGSGLKDQSRPDSMRMAPMPRISDTQQEAEAILRAYMRQMQGGE